MAQNLKVEITEVENQLFWNVKIEWLEKITINGEEYIETVRTWSVDAPSELAARTIQEGLGNMTDTTYDVLMNSGYER